MRTTLISFTIFLSLMGCSRKPMELSKVSIEMPSVHGKVGALAALPVGRVACYGVSISGSGINSIPASTCAPALGATFGFVPAGGTLYAEVSKGTSRTFDVYLYLQPTGENNPCPNMGSAFANLSSQNLYNIGTLASVNLEKDVENITITTTYPGDANHLYAVNAYSSSCLPVVTAPRSGYQISSSMGVTTGTGYILQGRVGRVVNGPELTGTGYKLRLKE